MSIHVIRNSLLWSTVTKTRKHTSDQFDALHYAGMSVYKIGIILFNLTPLVVLAIVG